MGKNKKTLFAGKDDVQTMDLTGNTPHVRNMGRLEDGPKSPWPRRIATTAFLAACAGMSYLVYQDHKKDNIIEGRYSETEVLESLETIDIPSPEQTKPQ